MSVCTHVSTTTSASTSASSLQVLRRSPQVRLYKEVETRALGETASRHQSGKVHICGKPRELRGDLVLGALSWWSTAPSREETEPDRVIHFVFLFRKVVL